MSAYRAILNARFRMLLQYRAAAMAGMSTQLFWGLMRVMIFTAFYRSTTAEQPMSLEQIITFIWLSQATLAMLPWNVDQEIHAMIRSGTVAYELARPVDLYWLWYTRAIAMRSAPTLLRAVPMFILAGLFLGLQEPASWAAGTACAVSMLGTLLLSSAITTLLNMTMLWTISGDGAFRLLVAGVILFSGMMVPLPFFPDWAQGVVNFLPFRGLADIPFRLYVGNLPAAHIGMLLGHQLVWTAVLILIGRLVLSRGTLRLVIQGG